MVSRLIAVLCALLIPLAVQAAGVTAGQQALPMTLPRLTTAGIDPGSPLTLSELEGKVVYLDFWASWCGPCRLSLPQMNELRAELGDQGFEVVAVSVDEVIEDAQAFLEEFPVEYPVVHDGSGRTPAAWGVPGMPTAYLIDRTGQVRHVHKGYRRGDAAKVRDKVLQLLGE